MDLQDAVNRKVKSQIPNLLNESDLI
jgi:hypothetical protein